jgi:hypothetical protein
VPGRLFTGSGVVPAHLEAMPDAVTFPPVPKLVMTLMVEEVGSAELFTQPFGSVQLKAVTGIVAGSSVPRNG